MSENEKQMQDLLLAITTLEKTQETTTKNVVKFYNDQIDDYNASK